MLDQNCYGIIGKCWSTLGICIMSNRVGEVKMGFWDVVFLPS